MWLPVTITTSYPVPPAALSLPIMSSFVENSEIVTSAPVAAVKSSSRPSGVYAPKLPNTID